MVGMCNSTVLQSNSNIKFHISLEKSFVLCIPRKTSVA